MLKTLCEMIGVSGYEKKLTNYLYSKLSDISYGEAFLDNIGNLIFHVRGKDSQKRVMIQAHIDEVGFQVISEIKKGQYSFKSLGNIKTWNAYQQRVKTDKGICGVIYANNPEQLKAYNYDNLILRAESDDEFGFISPGDVFTFDNSFYETSDFYIGKALDNRVSCYCLMEAIRQCGILNHDTYFCFSVMEEVNMRGSRVLKTTIQPNICITVDVSMVGERNSLKIGKGVGLKISDEMGISTIDCFERALAIAKENGIDYQLEVSDGGISELVISNEIDTGYEEIGVSIPCEYIHTANTRVSKKDVIACKQYLSSIIAAI